MTLSHHYNINRILEGRTEGGFTLRVPVLAGSDCCHKIIPRPGGLNTGVLFSLILRLKSRPGAGRGGFCWAASVLGLWKDIPFCCVLTWPLRPPWWLLLFQEGHQSCWTRAPPSWPHLNLIVKYPHCQIQLHSEVLGSVASHRDSRGIHFSW